MNFYKKFICKYAEIVESIQELLRKYVILNWTPQRQDVFDII